MRRTSSAEDYVETTPKYFSDFVPSLPDQDLETRCRHAMVAMLNEDRHARPRWQHFQGELFPLVPLEWYDWPREEQIDWIEACLKAKKLITEKIGWPEAPVEAEWTP